ncbi:response regulator [Brevundimonas sp.]|uniref:response regulator n=1 Tax=Brevundimonas sp. TaxID=1871086 RepID=UPI002FCC56DB
MTNTKDRPDLRVDPDVERLCALYDSHMDHDEPLSAAADAELRALARIFDLASDGPSRNLWPMIRSLLLKQVPSRPALFANPALPNPVLNKTVEEADMPREALNVLLVEDDAETAATLTEMLDEAGHRVIGPFHSAEAAEAATALHTIHLALLDINLSGQATGIDLARSLKSSWGVPVIFLSGDVSQAARHADMAAAMIIKPYSTADVLNAINRLEIAN